MRTNRILSECRASSLALTLGMLIGSCSSGEEKGALSTTQGPLDIVATREYVSLVDTLATEFARQYPTVRPSVRGATTREAIVALLNDSVGTVFCDRRLNEEERAVAQHEGIQVNTTRVAIDALAAVVNAKNAVQSFSRETLAALVIGEVSSWSEVAGSGMRAGVEFVSTGRNSGLYEVIQARVVGTPAVLRIAAVGETQSECVGFVSRTAGAFALVSMKAVRDLPPGVRVIPVISPPDTSGSAGVPVMPTQQSVYAGEYSLRYELFLLNTHRRWRTGLGFASFVATPMPQKMVQYSGLVPDYLPSRLVQLTSE